MNTEGRSYWSTLPPRLYKGVYFFTPALWLSKLHLYNFCYFDRLFCWLKYCFVSEPSPIKASLKIMSCIIFLTREKKRLIRKSDTEGKIGMHTVSDLSPSASEGFLHQAQTWLIYLIGNWVGAGLQSKQSKPSGRGGRLNTWAEYKGLWAKLSLLLTKTY